MVDWWCMQHGRLQKESSMAHPLALLSCLKDFTCSERRNYESWMGVYQHKWTVYPIKHYLKLTKSIWTPPKGVQIHSLLQLKCFWSSQSLMHYLIAQPLNTSINAPAVFSVWKLMVLKPPAISKCFPTLRTSIKSFFCMDPEASKSLPSAWECLGTQTGQVFDNTLQWKSCRLAPLHSAVVWQLTCWRFAWHWPSCPSNRPSSWKGSAQCLQVYVWPGLQ